MGCVRKCQKLCNFLCLKCQKSCIFAEGFQLDFYACGRFMKYSKSVCMYICERGHCHCCQSLKINTIIPAITSLSSNMFLSLTTFFHGLFATKFEGVLNKQKQAELGEPHSRFKLSWILVPLNFLSQK